jgi:HSP20 family molecular chaperone IbpA
LLWRLKAKQNNKTRLIKEKINMTTTNTLVPGHYSSTERVFSRLPDLFNDSWLTNTIGTLEKAFDIPNAVYPYNIKLVKSSSGEDERYEIEVALAGVGKNNIDIKVKDSLLNIEVKHLESEDKNSYLRKGISQRKGKLSFSLGEKVQKKNI